MVTAIILAGGTGSRVGANVPKQFINVLGKPVIAYTLENFEKFKKIDSIEIVCHKDWKDKVKEIVNEYNISKVKWIVDGGKTFQESVKNGVYNLKGKIGNEDIVVITFAVSPLTEEDVINDSIEVCQEKGNAISSEDIVLCTCIKDDEFSTTQNILRESLKGFSNPWTFKFGEVCEAYERAEQLDILDKIEPHTTSLFFALGKRLYFSKSSPFNFKITHKEDLDLFEGIKLLESKRRGE